jgi:hypothetical protein
MDYRGEAAVAAVIDAFVREIKRREQPHRAAEVLSRQRLRVLRERLELAVGFRRNEPLEVAQQRRLLPGNLIEDSLERHAQISCPASADANRRREFSWRNLALASRDDDSALHSAATTTTLQRRRDEITRVGLLSVHGRTADGKRISARPVPREVIEDCIRAAASAPSGANMQPWHFAS